MGVKQVKIEFIKTYATEDNAVKAAEKAFGSHESNLRFIVVPTAEGRFGVVFLGQSALQNMVHFKFNVLG